MIPARLPWESSASEARATLAGGAGHLDWDVPRRSGETSEIGIGPQSDGTG